MFSCEFSEISKNTFSHKIPPMTASVSSEKWFQVVAFFIFGASQNNVWMINIFGIFLRGISEKRNLGPIRWTQNPEPSTWVAVLIGGTRDPGPLPGILYLGSYIWDPIGASPALCLAQYECINYISLTFLLWLYFWYHGVEKNIDY